MLHPKTSGDLRRIIINQQIQYAECIQKIINLLKSAGGNSIIIAIAVTQLSKQYGVEIPFAKLDNPRLTIDEIKFAILNTLKLDNIPFNGKRIRDVIAISNLDETNYYEAIRELVEEDRVTRTGTGTGSLYELNKH